MNNRIRFGLIGCGGFGRIFSPYVQEAGDIAALCDPDLAIASETAKQLGLDVPRYDDYRTMLQEESLDAVIITAPNFLHAEITVAAAEAGCHVYCEKPMARTVPECWQMVRTCEQNNVKLMVGHKRRLRPPWARMIELKNDKLLGEVLSITVASYCDYRPLKMYGSWWADPSLSGGLFHTHSVHVVDWCRAMCGNARRVRAVSGPQHDPRWKFPDIVHATVEFASGAVASLNCGLLFPLQQFRECEGPVVECRHGGLKMVPAMDHIDLYWQRLDSAEIHHERFNDLGHAAAFRKELGDFVSWVREDRPPCLTWIEGLRCVELMEAADCSAAADGEPICLPLYPALESLQLEQSVLKEATDVISSL